MTCSLASDTRPSQFSSFNNSLTFLDPLAFSLSPIIKNEFVSAKIVEHFRTSKRISGKYKNKTRNRKRFGHRKSLTKIQIVEIPGLITSKSTAENNEKPVKANTKKATKATKATKTTKSKK